MAAASASLALAACGGGGDSTQPSTRKANPNIVIPPSAGPIAQIAKARPRPGSVTQSSNIGPDGITLDKITLTRDTQFTVSNEDRWTVTFSEGDNSSEPYYTWYNIPLGAPAIARKYEFTKSFTNDKNVVSNDGLGAFLDTPIVRGNYRTTDYLSLGMWYRGELRRCSSECEDKDDLEHRYKGIGAFIIGGDLFNDNNMPVAGSASYQGFADLLYISNKPVIRNYADHGSEVAHMVGDTFLRASFETGLIEGYITNIIKNSKNGESVVPGRLNLNSAKIGSSNSGFFDGDVTGTFEGKTYNGTYGGQFYGNGQSDGKPGTVAGTMGAISSDGSFTITGPWMADKERPRTADPTTPADP